MQRNRLPLDAFRLLFYPPPTMRWHIPTLLALVAPLVLSGSLRADTPSPPFVAPQAESFLVLLSGEVIQGQISKLDDKYVVVLPTGRIFVPETNVEIVCSDLREAYRSRQARAGYNQVQDHVELAQWCDRHRLRTEAEAELQIARRLDPDHPMVGLIERRLATSLQSHAATDDESDKEASSDPTPQQLEEFAAGLPVGTVAAFTRVVQPLLVNRCTTSGCHTDRSESEFRLERPRPGVPFGRTSTHRNLLAALKLVDASDPDQCELLSPKRCPHRLQTDAIASLSQSSQYRLLVAWVTLVTQQSARSSSARPAPTASPGSLPDTIRSGPPKPGERTTSTPLTFDVDSTPKDAPAASKTPAPPPALVAPVPANRNSVLDPFDPALFNRKYGTSAPSEAEPPSADKVPAPSAFFSG